MNFSQTSKVKSSFSITRKLVNSTAEIFRVQLVFSLTSLLVLHSQLGQANSYTYTASTASGDPCTYYDTTTTGTSICVDCYAETSTATSYLVVVNDTTTVCASQGYDTALKIDTCIVDNSYYAGETFYLASSFLATGTLTQSGYCIDKDTYYSDGSCGDTSIDVEVIDIISQFLDILTIGCANCSVSGYYTHGLADIFYSEEFYVKNDLNTLDWGNDYIEYGQFYVRTCDASTETVACERTEYYNTSTEQCQYCACKWPYCIYCNQTDCLIYATDLAYFTEYTNVIDNNCNLDPCESYYKTTDNCESCPVFTCAEDYTTGTFTCSYFAYLFIDTTTTVCAYSYTYTNNQRYCSADNSYYEYEDYYQTPYNATASSVTSNVYCMACDYYNTVSGINKCTDSCANSDPLTIIQQYINGYAIGCGVCNTLFEYQQVAQSSFLPSIYLKTCTLTSGNNTCAPDEYYDPYNDGCERCACKFSNCAACSYQKCVLTYDGTIDISNCSYADPCLSYVSDSGNCQECSSNPVYVYSSTDEVTYEYVYRLLIIDWNTTICATYGLASTFGYTSSNYLCQIQDPYYIGESYYDLAYYAQGVDQYCIACDLYYVDSSGASLCADSCLNEGTGKGYLARSVSSHSVGCGICAQTDYLMLSLTEVSYISGLYISNCTATIDGVSCSLTEYYDSTTKSCISCTESFSNCAACNSTTCQICADNFYFFTNTTYDYATDSFVTTSQCSFEGCPAGQGIIDYTQYCQDCSISHCLSCELDSDTDIVECTACYKGYYLDSTTLTCIDMYTDELDLTYFISSGGAYDVLSSDLEDYYSSDYGQSPDYPYYFIQQALYDISQNSITNQKIVATIYLGAGNHFFYYCSAFNQNGNSLTEYCDSTNFEDFSLRFIKAQFYTDDITLSFKAMECSLATYLGYDGDSNYTAMCVDLTTDSKPTIYVNQPQAYFSLWGNTYFSNLIFSGINQYVRTKVSIYDLTTLPLLYCSASTEPSPSDTEISLEVSTISGFPIAFYCFDSWVSFNNIPDSTSSIYTCERNDYSQFYPAAEGTLSATGEPDLSDFFYQGDTFVEENSGIPPLRHHTLFDLISFPEYKSISLTPPSLTIDNCEFEYFLDSYESLINVANNQLYNLTVTQNYTDSDFNLLSEDWQFFIYDGGERGAKITITNSIFKHSAFTKGLIVYRKQPYISWETMGFANKTYLYMTTPLVADTGSFIYIDSSYFYNLNFMKNVTALAIYGGSEVVSALYDYLGTVTVDYQTFLHNGIVLNVEDFGGDIEVYNSTFEANMHFIPEILITNHSSSITKNLASFKDSSLSLEYKMSYCDLNGDTDTYFFQNGIDQSDDIDAYYDEFERLSLIYISRNRGAVMIRSNNFTQNMGTFGGAININSMNRQQDIDSPYIAIYDNTFTKNMAYFSGNAIYIRMTKSETEYDEICGGGVLIKGNTFEYNIGMKVHNGGAISVVCTFITSTHQDYHYRSSEAVSSSDSMTSTSIISTLDTVIKFSVTKYILQIQDNYFSQNYAGLKGTAVYLNYLSYPQILDCTFYQNGPVFSYFETQYSPYFYYFSGRTITYYDQYGVCLTEFQFLASCSSSDNYIDFSHVQGALYVGHCEESYCINSTNTMQLEIESTNFDNNQAGPVLDQYFPNDLASQLYIEGGFSNYIYLVDFNSNTGAYFQLVENRSQHLIDYFPPDYFYSQTVPLITIYVDPSAAYASSILDFETNFTACNFKENIHYQVLGLTDSQMFSGSLINYISEYGVSTDNFAPFLQIENSYFYDNQFIGTSTSLIYVYNGILYFNDNTMMNNGMITSKTMISPTYTIFTYNPFETYSASKSQQYGMIKIQGSETLPESYYHIVSGNTFTYTFSEFGSVYNMFLENQYIKMSSNMYSYNFASKQGSVLNGLGSVSQSLIVMENENINYQFSLNGTLGITSYDLTTMSLILNKTHMYQFYSTEGSALNVVKAQKIIINECIFKINSTNKSLDLAISTSFDQMTYPLNQFIDTTSYNKLVKTNITSATGSIYIDTVDGSSQNGFAGILIQDDTDEYASYVEVYNTEFTNLYADSASVFYVSDSNIRYKNDISSSYGVFNCSQYEQGAIYINNGGQMVGENLIFNNISSGSTASVLFLSQQSSASFTNSNFTNNYATGQGLHIVEGSSSLTLASCYFSNNYAKESAIIFADNNPSGIISIDNSHFENNTSQSNLFYLIFTTSQITNSKFLNNIAQQVNHGITMTNSILTLDNVLIDYTDADFLSNNNTKVDAGFININFESSFVLKNSIISNTRGKTSGFLYATGQSNISISENTVIQNCYSKIGSIIYMSSTNQVSISNSQFTNNTLMDISINNGNATLSQNTFYKGDQQFIYATSSSLEVIENKFLNGQNTGINGKAIYCNCLNLTVVNSVFDSLAAVQGGALYLTSTSLSSVFLVHNNTFSSNSAQQGGAVYIEDGPLISILNNSFTQNTASVISPSTQASALITAKGQGGAIFYNCLNTDLGLDGNCLVYIEKENKFIANSAADDGGAIQWITNAYQDDDTNIFSGNSAYYGTDVGSYPKELSISFITNNDYYNPVTNSQRRLSTSSYVRNRMLTENGFEALVSGVAFEFVIYIIDQQGNVYSADSSSIASLVSADASDDVLFKNNQITASNGVYNFSNLIAYTNPGTSFNMRLEVSGLTTYGNSISFVDSPIDIPVTFRSCVAGEELTSSPACVACANGTYSFFAPVNESTCYDCSTDANCYGYNYSSPKAGYWRANATTDSWVTCPRAASCLGGNKSEPTGVCADGYTGIACAECDSGYSYSNYECTVCPSQTKNIVYCAVIIAFILFYSAFLVRSTIQSAGRDKPLYSVYLKIMTNHFQIIGAISGIDFNWPTQITSFQSSQTTATQTTTQLFNFSCLLDSWSVTASIGTYYEILILYALSPVVFTLLAALFWVIYSGIKKNFKDFKDYFISTVVVLLFLLHPSITTAMFSAFNCIELDGTYYLKGDIATKCYQGKHTFYIYTVIMPSIIVWIIGIPLFALLCLFQNRTILRKSLANRDLLNEEEKAALIRVKLKYGFLFDGYVAKVYFWEILILYRKILLIMSTVFLSVVSPESQVLVAMMIVIVNMLAHSFYEPFYTHTLNKMEQFSLQVASITMYCGLFYITGEHYTYMDNNILKWFFLICLIVPNLLFFGYWLVYMHIEIAKIILLKSIILFKIITCNCIKVERFIERFVNINRLSQGPPRDQIKEDDYSPKSKMKEEEINAIKKIVNISIQEEDPDERQHTNTDINTKNGPAMDQEDSKLIIRTDEIKLDFDQFQSKKNSQIVSQPISKKPTKYLEGMGNSSLESDANTIKYDNIVKDIESENNRNQVKKKDLKMRKTSKYLDVIIPRFFQQENDSEQISIQNNSAIKKSKYLPPLTDAIPIPVPISQKKQELHPPSKVKTKALSPRSLKKQRRNNSDENDLLTLAQKRTPKTPFSPDHQGPQKGYQREQQTFALQVKALMEGKSQKQKRYEEDETGRKLDEQYLKDHMKNKILTTDSNY